MKIETENVNELIKILRILNERKISYKFVVYVDNYDEEKECQCLSCKGYESTIIHN